MRVDLHPVKPKWIGKSNKVDRKHAMLITDDTTQFRTVICISKKSDASSTLRGWTEQFKERTGYYPTVRSFDNAKP
ncbi:hypothetical protein N7491_001662 [Penicillium cf. griseofulvum]|uniref:Uncharacterized protein n=1 Tax=Penicillium cf. griseofulvum TaxID=2972120 RepID=A0A9W9JG51_9EURO|nr:hypothetical protein N7472_006791 [Penicillium cf. griseofulvum]KAJ5445580.1 hypothetical protein N7491_001662 [Penicillium cf. griseofulvum]KAJ5447302.1 hypothetical protein N7445_002123 [Penicillium cf. griseofulvum]